MDVTRFLQQTADPERRARDYRRLVSGYYDNLTRFYVWGWGEYFHFAPLGEGSEGQGALAAQRDRLIGAAGITARHRVLDVGCGVGGPTRYIARQSGARVTGITISPAQVKLAREMIRKQGLAGTCEVLFGDAMHMRFGDESFDVVTMIESACHMPDKGAFFRECARVLGAGGVLAGWDWIRLEAADPARVEPICRYFALPQLSTLEEIGAHLRGAGLVVERLEDLGAPGPGSPWWSPLQQQLERPLARLTARLSRRLGMMWQSGELLVRAGQAGTFSPLGFFVARKPAAPGARS